MRVQKEMKRKLLITSLLGALIAVAIWVFALSSEEYRITKGVVTSEALAQRVGQIEYSVLTGFRLSYGEGRTSSMSVYLIGTKSRGWLRVTLEQGRGGTSVVSATFEGQAVGVR